MTLLMLFLFIFISPAYAEIALDSKYLEAILKQHPDDIETRLLLASYYLNVGDLNKSEALIKKALEQESNNRMALDLYAKWLVANERRQFLKQLNVIDLNNTQAVDEVVGKLYKKKDFDSLNQLFSLLAEKNIALSKQSQISYASILVEQKKYKQANKVIGLIEDQSNELVQKLLAETCFALKDMQCAAQSFENLFNSSGSLESGVQFAEALIQQGKIIDARNVSDKINEKYANQPKARVLSKRVTRLFNRRVTAFQKIYQEQPSAKNVQNFSKSLYERGDKVKASEVLLQYIKKHPENDQVKLFAVEQYAWNKQLYSAIDMLLSLKQQTPETQLLLAKYLSWTGKNLKKSQTILKNLLKQAELKKDSAYTETIINDATILLANTYLLSGDKSKAQTMLEPIVKKDPSNKAAQESYFLATSKYKPLIDQYEKQLKNDPDNAQVILRLANLYEAAKYNDKALQYYERYRTIERTDPKVEKAMGLLYLTQKKYDLAFKLLKRHAYRQHTEKSLLMLAKNYHWNGYNQDALEVIGKLQAYYPASIDAVKLREQVLKGPLAGRNKDLIAANKEYEETNYKSAVHYFKKYLNKFPNDYYVRNRYAYALGQIGSYSKAVKEFSRVAQAKPNDLSIQYHYAYNLEQSENYQQAKKIYIKIIEQTSEAAEKARLLSANKQDPNVKLNELAGLRLKILEKNKDIIVNGIYLGGGVKKVLAPENEVLSNAFVAPAQLGQNKAHSSFVAEDVLYYSPRNTKRIALDFQHTSDRTGVDLNNPLIRAQYNSWPYEINFSGGGFTFENNVCDGEAGGSVELSGMYKNSTSLQYGGGLRIDQFGGKTVFSPFINSRLNFNQSSVDIQLYKRPLFFEKLACNALTKHINRYGIQASGNIEFSKKQALWYSVDAGYIDDSNIEVIPQFNLVVYKDKLKNRYVPVDYEFALEGYYMWNRRETDDYYSPKVFDSTSLSLRPIFKVSKDFDVISSGAIGYSVDVGSIIFRYGLWAQYTIDKGLKAKAGCERSNIGSANAGGQNYHSDNCLATLEYEWQ